MPPDTKHWVELTPINTLGTWRGGQNSNLGLVHPGLNYFIKLILLINIS